ncbi:small multi-drug export protein [Herbivorax sp. ANBcel31]|uniref:COG2426 family protein n=1 Tax=Herbivorax sp. ANBcel31 TaxID=3069754 RepID=UPI0027B6527C|nr:small multi-drug export protein [Herbivorax sp. ANBcel31]MDQ2085180.1 small multi-drug export protein [Herbivorax sp. ANBcel31]
MFNLLPYIFLAFISALPVIEQRGSIPIGILLYELNPSYVFLTCLLGSLIPAPIILLLFKPIFNWIKKFSFLNWFTNFVENKLQKNTPKIEKYKEIGLILFVSIPLPSTGVWTSCGIAAILGLDIKRSLFCAFIGALISAIILSLFCYFAPSILGGLGLNIENLDDKIPWLPQF